MSDSVLKCLPRLEVVVQLAVVDEGQVFVVADERLVTRREIDDRKASVAEAHTAVNEISVSIGPAMHQRARHAPHERVVGRPCRVEMENARYPAHAENPICA